MTRLLNKVEINLGTKPMNLPKEIAKPMWGNPEEGPIPLFTIPTFSRYFPNKITVTLNNARKVEGGWYVLDEAIGVPDGVTITGVRDIDWTAASRFGTLGGAASYGYYTPTPDAFDAPSILMQQGFADLRSAFGNVNNIFVNFKEPNLIRLEKVGGVVLQTIVSNYPIDIFIEHNLNLSTISPTKMETFEALACADVANFLYKFLRHYDKIETVFANSDMGLDELRDIAATRPDIIANMENAYVSAANDNQPLLFTI